MSAKEDSKAATAIAVEAVAAVPLTLSEFCSRLSETDRRPELIAGFHLTETAAGRASDIPEAFAARFVEFVNKPV